jgi:hypothetical protein
MFGKGEVIRKTVKSGVQVGTVCAPRYIYRVSDVTPKSPAESDPPASRRLVRDLALYTVARLGLVALIAAAIVFGAKMAGVEVPILVALIFALLIALPLSLVLFSKLRRRVNEDIAVVDERRRRDKADLRAKLRGDA